MPEGNSIIYHQQTSVLGVFKTYGIFIKLSLKKASMIVFESAFMPCFPI